MTPESKPTYAGSAVADVSAVAEPRPFWWGEQTLDFGQTYHLNMGGFHLAVTRLLHEWQVRYERETEHADLGEWQSDINYNLPSRELTLQRISMQQTHGGLRLWPALADRPVVIRPYHPFLLPPGESATIYVSSLLWIQVHLLGKAPFHVEIPVQMASETWIGPNAMDGELCYAEMTSARMDPKSLPRRAYRAITPLHIHNRARDTLNLERVSLPIPFLDLYANGEGALWTSEVTYVRTEETASARIDISHNPPSTLVGARRVTAARQKADRSGLVKAIDRLFG